MPSDLDYLFLHSTKCESTPNGTLTIRRALLPRLVRGLIAGLIAVVLAAVFLPLQLAPAIAVLAAFLSYKWLGRPLVEFDPVRGVLTVGRYWIPFLADSVSIGFPSRTSVTAT